MLVNANWVKEVLSIGYEQRRIEFKSSGSLKDKAYRAKIIRAAIALANTSGGGYILIGVSEDSDNPTIENIEQEILSTWNYDDIRSAFAPYVEPYIDFDFYQVDVDNKAVLVLSVDEFKEIPVICRKSYPDILKEGFCYVRSLKRLESGNISTEADMRELLELAVEKGVQTYLKKIQKYKELDNNPKELFDKEFEDIL